MLTYYLRSRVADKDVKKIFDVLIADKLKDCLPAGTLQYVLSLEGDLSFSPSKVASSADIYASNYNDKGFYRGNSVTNVHLGNSGNVTDTPQNQKPGYVSNKSSVRSQSDVSVSRHFKDVSRVRDTNDKGKRVCWECGSDSHLLSQCPNKSKQVNSRNVKPVGTIQAKSCVVSASRPDVIVRTSNTSEATCADNPVSVDYVGPGVKSGLTSDLDPSVGQSLVTDSIMVVKEAIVETPVSKSIIATDDSHATDEVAHVNNVTVDRVGLSQLNYVDIVINGCKLRALSDSGCECPLINKDAFCSVSDKSLSTVGEIWVQPIVGPAVAASLAALDVTQHCMNGKDDGEGRPLHLVFAVVDNLVGHEVVLPADIVNELKHTSQYCATRTCVNAVCTKPLRCNFDVGNECVSINNVTVDDSTEILADTGDSICGTAGDVNLSLNVGSTILASEQISEVTLSDCRSLARAKKGGFEWRDGLLYHVDYVVGQRVDQLVVPKDRRSIILKLAHDKCGYHQGQKRTSERIRYSFYWPGQRADVVNYCNQCLECLQRARLRTDDRCVINAIERPELPGAHLMMDCIGPIDPPSALGHKYLLCIIDVCTNWPTVYLLKNLSAKSVCDCLCDVFSNLGVASVISSDNATNFSSRLTQECLRRFGCSPRFSTPGHPEAQGKIERFNQSYKRLLHHAIKQNPRQWHKCVPFLTWAMRECSNASTNVSPYLLLYGRLPRGPLAVLKETWSGERELPRNFNKSETQYMTELKQNLEIARKYASDHAVVAQERYVTHYNRHAKNKSFDVGENVIVLHPDSTNKLLSRWQVGTVAEVMSPNSYLVDMPDGARRHLQANKLRPYAVYAQSVIMDKDRDFGRVLSLPVVSSDLLPSQKIDCRSLSHLTDVQRNELLQILDCYPEIFAEKPGFCNLVEHEIVTVSNFVPKRSKPYKVPEALKAEVDRQIEVLLKDRFIRPSTSPMTSPIVCVLKKTKNTQQNGIAVTGKPEVRIAVDYRYLNSYTQSYPFPVPDQEQVLAAIGNFKVISVFDLKSGYHQTAIKKEHVWLSAFVTHSAEYEWLRTPFGMKNSGSTFCRVVHEVLKPIKEFTISYVDDMAVGSQTWSEHKVHLNKFFTIMKDSGLTVNLRKTEFAKSQVKFVGHMVGSGSKTPDPDRLRAIKEISRPQTRKQVKSVLGMLGYHRDFIYGYAELAKPLTDLTSSKVSFDWTDREQNAFDTLKDRLCKATALYTPRIGKLFIIRSDASGVAVAACLSQQTDDSIEVNEKGTGERPVAFCSQKLTPTQCAWSVIEREAYAVIFALKKFHYLIFGAPIIVYSDHNPLIYIVESASKSAKLVRWSLALQEHCITFRYVRSANNKSADCLSRLV